MTPPSVRTGDIYAVEQANEDHDRRHSISKGRKDE